MATTKQFKENLLIKLSILRDITCRSMMGEYLLYYKGVLFGGIYDNKLLVKRTHSNAKYNLSEVIPYTNAKPMYHIENLESEENVCEIILSTYNDLKEKNV